MEGEILTTYSVANVKVHGSNQTKVQECKFIWQKIERLCMSCPQP